VTSLLFHLVHLHFQKKEEPFGGFGKARLHFLAWRKLKTPTQEILALVGRRRLIISAEGPLRQLLSSHNKSPSCGQKKLANKWAKWKHKPYLNDRIHTREQKSDNFRSRLMLSSLSHREY
jgi:hypothetical protein